MDQRFSKLWRMRKGGNGLTDSRYTRYFFVTSAFAAVSASASPNPAASTIATGSIWMTANRRWRGNMVIGLDGAFWRALNRLAYVIAVPGRTPSSDSPRLGLGEFDKEGIDERKAGNEGDAGGSKYGCG